MDSTIEMMSGEYNKQIETKWSSLGIRLRAFKERIGYE